MVLDAPIRVGTWAPENHDGRYRGRMTLKAALAHSANTPAVRLLLATGPAAVAKTARRLGITSKLGRDASLALGTSEVTPLELTAAYVPFANGGKRVEPHIVQRITTTKGRVLYQRLPAKDRIVVRGDVLAEMNDMLRAVITEGTAKRANLGGIDAAGKTGTSQAYRDAWFVGYTSALTAGVWVGNDDNTPMRKVMGGGLPAKIWRELMLAAHRGLQPGRLPGLRRSAPRTDEIALAPQAPTIGSTGGLADLISGLW
jgi:penicillin-binding protein 1A